MDWVVHFHKGVCLLFYCLCMGTVRSSVFNKRVNKSVSFRKHGERTSGNDSLDSGERGCAGDACLLGAHAAFGAADKDGDGKLSFQELLQAVGGGDRESGDPDSDEFWKTLKKLRDHGKSQKGSKNDDEQIPDHGSSTSENQCASISDLNRCADTAGCFPHYTSSQDGHMSVCVPSQQLACLMDTECASNGHVSACIQSQKSDKIKILLTSDGISNDDLRYALRTLVLKLPDESWDGGLGWSKKKLARASNVDALARQNFREPSLFAGLKVLELTDACFLKQYSTPPGKCWQMKDDLEDLGFSQVSSISLFDIMPKNASEEQHIEHRRIVEGVMRLQAAGDAVISSAVFDDIAKYRQKYFSGDQARFFSSILDSVDVLAFAGGSVDFLAFVLTKMAADVGSLIQDRVRDGSLILVGKSAGSMVTGFDFGLSVDFENSSPNIGDNLLKCESGGDLKNFKGLGLTGRCAVRPHYDSTFDVATAVYERTKSLNVVRLPDGEGMMCVGASCKMVGVQHQCDSPETNCTPVAAAMPHSEGRSNFAFKRRPCIAGQVRNTPI